MHSVQTLSEIMFSLTEFKTKEGFELIRFKSWLSKSWILCLNSSVFVLFSSERMRWEVHFINANSILSNSPRSISLCQRALWNSHLVGGGAYFVGKYKWIKDKLNRNVQQPFLPVGSNWCRGWKMSKSIISPLYPAVFALWMRGILSEKILLASK